MEKATWTPGEGGTPEGLTYHSDQDQGGAGQAGQRVEGRAVVDPLVFPGQGRNGQRSPHIHSGGVLKGPAVLGAGLGLSPTLQGQAGVELRRDVADYPRPRPHGDIHSVRAICVQSQMLCTCPPLAGFLFCPVRFHIGHFAFFSFLSSNSDNVRLYPGKQRLF